MNQSRISFNVHAQNIVNNGAFWQYMRTLNPKALYILDDGGTATSAKEKLPDTEVIYRFNGDGGDDGEALLKYQPKELLAKLLSKVNGDKRIVLSIGNEMPLNKRVVDWLCEVVKEANVQDIRLGVLNLAVGNPTGDDPIGAWDVAKPLLQLLAEHRQHYLLLHEYFFVVPTSGFYGGWPDNAGVAPSQGGGLNLVPAENWPRETRSITMYHCGRFKFLLAYCDKEGIPYPRIGLSEHGEDELNDIKDWSNKLEKAPNQVDFKGWRHCERAWRVMYARKGWTPERAYAEMLIYLDEYVYQNSPVEWQCVFSMFQSSEQWGPFNVWGATGLLDPIVIYAQQVKEEVAPVLYPFPTENDERLVDAVLVTTGAVSFLRESPTITGNAIEKFTTVIVKYIPLGLLTDDEKHYDVIEFGKRFYWLPAYWDGKKVWFREDAARIEPTQKPAPPPPVNLPPDDDDEPETTPSEPSSREVWNLEAKRLYTEYAELHLELSGIYKRLAINEASIAELFDKEREMIREERLNAA